MFFSLFPLSSAINYVHIPFLLLETQVWVFFFSGYFVVFKNLRRFLFVLLKIAFGVILFGLHYLFCSRHLGSTNVVS